MDFSLDKNALNRVLESGISNLEEEYQRSLDKIADEHKGKQAAEIKPHIVAWAEECEVPLSDELLTKIATDISEGKLVSFEA